MTFHSVSDSQFKFIRIKLIDHTMVNGVIDLSRFPGYEQVSDIVSSSEESFITLDQVTMYAADFQTRQKYDILQINKTQILWVESKLEANQ